MFNPLKRDALTADTVREGMRIISWKPEDPSSVLHLTILTAPWVDEDGDRVIEVLHRDGHTNVVLTSEVGLSGDRYNGGWVAIAIVDDELD